MIGERAKQWDGNPIRETPEKMMVDCCASIKRACEDMIRTIDAGELVISPLDDEFKYLRILMQRRETIRDNILRQRRVYRK